MVGFITVFWMFFMLVLVGCVIAWVVRQRKESA
jgi:cbb3-type cytochrome oxidase subunit 3